MQNQEKMNGKIRSFESQNLWLIERKNIESSSLDRILPCLGFHLPYSHGAVFELGNLAVRVQGIVGQCVGGRFLEVEGYEDIAFGNPC